MGFWSLFEVAIMPVLEVLLVSLLGAFMSTSYSNLLLSESRRSLNKIVFMVFVPSLMFASLAKTVSLEDIISWWFMPINIGITFLVGGILGWILVKILRPTPHLEGLVIAACSSGNLGNLLLIIVPAICDEDGSPFSDEDCSSIGLSYASFSMALGGFYIWTFTYHLIRSSSVKLKTIQAAEEVSKPPNEDLNADVESHLLKQEDEQHDAITATLVEPVHNNENEATVEVSVWSKMTRFLHTILEELIAPPTLAAIIGLIFGAITWLKDLIIGDIAPLHVIQDSVNLLGNAAIPCITLILGGNLTQGLRSSKLKIFILIGIVFVRYVLSPLIGIGVVEASNKLGFLPSDPLYRYVLMVQFTLPPAMTIGTMTELFDVGQEECSVIFLWTYVVAALALALWSIVYMWILS